MLLVHSNGYYSFRYFLFLCVILPILSIPISGNEAFSISPPPVHMISARCLKDSEGYLLPYFIEVDFSRSPEISEFKSTSDIRLSGFISMPSGNKINISPVLLFRKGEYIHMTFKRIFVIPYKCFSEKDITGYKLTIGQKTATFSISKKTDINFAFSDKNERTLLDCKLISIIKQKLNHPDSWSSPLKSIDSLDANLDISKIENLYESFKCKNTNDIHAMQLLILWNSTKILYKKYGHGRNQVNAKSDQMFEETLKIAQILTDCNSLVFSQQGEFFMGFLAAIRSDFNTSREIFMRYKSKCEFPTLLQVTNKILSEIEQNNKKIKDKRKDVQ